ncbi:site-2 protease family protein [Alkaliphilus transvaalensis]|uniref:site-2 protease family protein n=1 Tax=Alkaliphilus transvaalensis TaxID=114628 RepID=UPI00047E6FF1|nr:site-2 protease family protein [Alkaliphilus transvaalensis]
MFPFNINLFDLERIILTVPAVLMAITLHEFAHGYSAYLMGDPTAKERGRLSLNPLAHLDPFGFILLLVAGFGWAKPVPINAYYFKKRRLGIFIVSIAGVVTNFILATLLTIALGLQATYYPNGMISDMITYGIWINLVLGVFNLFPIPPLDGSKIILSILPNNLAYYFHKIEKYSYVILIALIFFGAINKVLFPVTQFLLSLLVRFILVPFF